MFGLQGRTTPTATAQRAELLGVIHTLQLVSSWPARDHNEWKLTVSGVELGDVASAARIVDTVLDDWVLVVSDGRTWPEVVSTQGRARLTLEVEHAGLDTIGPLLREAIAPDKLGAGLWVYVGRFEYVPVGGGEIDATFVGEYRPATRDDLRLLGVDQFEWLNAYAEHDGDQVRAVCLGMHGRECPMYAEAARFPFDDANTTPARDRAFESATFETCTCTQYAAHVAPLVDGAQ